MPCPIIMLLLISTSPTESVSLTVGERPLLEVIESRLASLDELVTRKESRPALPTDKWFRYRFNSRSLAGGVRPTFPAGLPGAIPLLEHPDARVRCAILLIIQKWLEERRSFDRTNLQAELSQADVRRLRLAILGCVASSRLRENALITGEFAMQVFSRLATAPLTDAEEELLLQKLAPMNAQRNRQIVELFLTVAPSRFPTALQAPTRQLLGSSSTERNRIVLLLQRLKAAPPNLQQVLQAELRREPHAWSAKHLAILLFHSGARSPEMAAGMVGALTQEIPPRGGMRGRGSMSYLALDSPNRWTVMQQRQTARLALMTLPVDQPQVVPQLMKLLDADDYETRAIGVAVLSRFRSGSLIAVPKMLSMNMADNRPLGRIRIGAMRLGLGFNIFYSVKQIIAASLMDLHAGNAVPMFISTGAFLSDQWPWLRDATRGGH